MAEDEPDAEYDGPWKEALEWFLDAFFAMFFPAVAALIDWSRGYEFLDKELEAVHPEAAEQRGTVDKLVRLWLRTGDERHAFIHVEVQSQAQASFAERMYTYNHRLRDRYGRMPISVAILGDDRPTWRPTEFVEEAAGCSVRFRFLTAKLLEWSGQDAELGAVANPFAVLIRAHLQTQATRGDPAGRQAMKWQLARGLYDRGLDRERILRLFKLIDWMMTLAPPRQVEFTRTVRTFEEGLQVPFVSVLEELAMERGRVETLHTGIRAILEKRFGSRGADLSQQIRGTTTVAVLAEIQLLAATASDLGSFEEQLSSLSSENRDATP